ncbi:MAG: hypothetical protein M0R17_04415 [Candidatus Omnitrophica bacterium]|jgi:hypothetical protein|nr:hypothetical protein [Candidatus Omnitrophota bacterium]
MEEEYIKNVKPFQRIPGRIKYYLLEWKDRHMSEYINKYGEISLNNLTIEQIQGLYTYVCLKDAELLKTII